MVEELKLKEGVNLEPNIYNIGRNYRDRDGKTEINQPTGTDEGGRYLLILSHEDIQGTQLLWDDSQLTCDD